MSDCDLYFFPRQNNICAFGRLRLQDPHRRDYDLPTVFWPAILFDRQRMGLTQYPSNHLLVEQLLVWGLRLDRGSGQLLFWSVLFLATENLCYRSIYTSLCTIATCFYKFYLSFQPLLV